MSADFDDLGHRLASLRSEVGRSPLPGPAAARARGRRRARNQAVGALVGAAVIVGGAVIAVAQPTLRTAPDPADQPSESVSPTVATPTPSPTDATLPDSVLLTVADIEPDGEPIGWAETDPPAQGWPCVPPVPDSSGALQRHFENPERGRIQQVVEPTGAVDQAAARFAEIRDELIRCVEDGTAAGDDFRLDQVWSVTGVGDEALLVRYWAPPREGPPGVGQLIVSVSIVRTGEAVTSVARGGFAQDANVPDTTDDAEAAVTRLCAETGGACVTDPAQVQDYPEPAGDVPGWLTLAEVARATEVDRITAASDVMVAPDGSFGFVCFQADAGAAGAVSIASRTFHDPFDPGGIGVDEFIARFPTAAAARAYYDTLAAEGDACSAEPALSVQNTGTITGDRVATEGGYVLYELDGAQPRVSVVADWRVVDDLGEALRAVTARAFDPAVTAVVESEPGIAPSADGYGGSATYEEIRPEDIRIDVRAETPSLVVVRNAWEGGWEATVDGSPATVLVADAFLQAVAVPAGEHVIRLTYVEPVIGRSIAASAVVWGALAIAVAAVAVRERRRATRRLPRAS